MYLLCWLLVDRLYYFFCYKQQILKQFIHFLYRLSRENLLATIIQANSPTLEKLLWIALYGKGKKRGKNVYGPSLGPRSCTCLYCFCSIVPLQKKSCPRPAVIQDHFITEGGCLTVFAMHVSLKRSDLRLLTN